MATKHLAPLLSHQVFRWASGVSALISVALGILGSLLSGNPDLRSTHNILGIAFLVASLVAGLSGMRYGKESRTKGLTGHGLGVFGLAVLQFGLGEMGQTVIHMILGFLLVIGAGALFAMALRKPPAVITAEDRPDAAAPR